MSRHPLSASIQIKSRGKSSICDVVPDLNLVKQGSVGYKKIAPYIASFVSWHSCRKCLAKRSQGSRLMTHIQCIQNFCEINSDIWTPIRIRWSCRIVTSIWNLNFIVCLVVDMCFSFSFQASYRQCFFQDCFVAA